MNHSIRPGLHHVSNEAYHDGPGTSKSGLDLLHKSAELFAYAKSEAGVAERKSTPAQAFGSAYHAIVLEPDVFVRTYTLALRQQDVPEAIDDREVLVSMVQQLNAGRLAKLPTTGSKAEQMARIAAADAESVAAGRIAANLAHTVDNLASASGADLRSIIDALNSHRAGLLPVSGSRHDLADLLRANGVSVTLWSDVQAEWLANNAGRIVLSQADWDTLHAMRDKLFQHKAAGALLRKRGAAELSFYWIDIHTGELLRCRPDYLTDSGLIIDLKTALDASPEGFRSSVQNYRYDVQHPFYLDGVNAAIEQGGLDRAKAREFIFIAQEKKPPYSVGVYRLDPEDVELGRFEYRADLAHLAECRAADAWPGYGEEIQQLSLKAWHRQESALASAAVH